MRLYRAEALIDRLTRRSDRWQRRAIAAEGALEVAEARLRVARIALVRTGYFTEDEVGDDVAPRIIELHSALTADQT